MAVLCHRWAKYIVSLALGKALNTHSCNVVGLINLINGGDGDVFIENIVSTYYGYPITEWNLVVAPIYLQVALCVEAFYMSIELVKYNAVFDLLDGPSTAVNLGMIFNALREIGAKEECEWMASLKELMPGAMFPRSEDVARGISRELEEELHCGTGRSSLIADLCERSQNNKWDTKGCFHRWAAVNQQRIVLDIYRRDVVNLLSRFSTTAPVWRC